MPPVVETNVSHHTVWQALTGELPPLQLRPAAVGRATLDSRDVAPGDLFFALVGQSHDGHAFIPAALNNGAMIVVCEERGREAARFAGAAVIDCTQTRWTLHAELPGNLSPETPLVYIVDSAEGGLQQLGGFQRLHRSDQALRVIGITGSVGKTSTKELTTDVMQSPFSHVGDSGQPEQRTRVAAYLAGLEYGTNVQCWKWACMDLGEIRAPLPCWVARTSASSPMVGPVHLSRLGTIERIAQAKAELPAVAAACGRRRASPSSTGTIDHVKAMASSHDVRGLSLRYDT